VSGYPHVSSLEMRPGVRTSYCDHFQQEGDLDFDPELWLYRERTAALLRRYLQSSIEIGRLPSLLGRELFRSKVTAYHMSSFEDGVIFVHDVEHTLEQLSDFWKQLISLMIFQDYTQDEAADALRCARRTVNREFWLALDRVSELFLAGGLLNPLPNPTCGKVCQEGERSCSTLSACKQGE
jgi:ECF sigma factor